MTSSSPASDTATEPITTHLRPSAHFTTQDTWLNDPNGLVHHKGVYHLFYQNNPEGSTWGNISWGHATSTDLVSWTEKPVAIRNTPDEMVFSGSAVVDHHNTSGLAGPDQVAMVAVFTSASTAASSHPGRQAQSLAYSLDDGDTWTRYRGNPVLDIGSSEFRDPKVFWYGGRDGHWVMVAVEAVERRVVVYTSPDLIAWTRASHVGPAHAVGGVWECPDLFPLRVRGSDRTRWVLLVSLNPGGIAGGSGTQYFLGDFDGTTFTPDRLSTSDQLAGYDWLDHGRDYYAAVSFSGVPDDRRLTVGWASNWDYADETPTAPWRSAMSLVRELDLVEDRDGTLRIAQRPVLPPRHERADHLLVHELQLDTGPGRRHQIVLSSRARGEGDRVTITVDGDRRTLSCDRTQSGAVDFHPSFPSVDNAPLLGSTTTDLLLVVDGCVVEIYVDGGLVTLTQLVFPSSRLAHVHHVSLA